jgi:hypothetical protein
MAVIGADEAPDSWFERWGLWNVFGIALVVVFVYWMTGLVPAVIAAVALLLTYQEMPAFIWLWGNLLAALAIVRAAPEGRFRKIAQGYRTASFVVLALALLPFMWMQVRYALYPQLEESSSFGYDTGRQNLAVMDTAAPAAAEAAAPEEEFNTAMQPAPVQRSEVKKAGRLSGLNSVQVVQRYASGTRLQAGPGIPAWNYNTYP